MQEDVGEKPRPNVTIIQKSGEVRETHMERVPELGEILHDPDGEKEVRSRILVGTNQDRLTPSSAVVQDLGQDNTPSRDENDDE